MCACIDRVCDQNGIAQCNVLQSGSREVLFSRPVISFRLHDFVSLRK